METIPRIMVRKRERKKHGKKETATLSVVLKIEQSVGMPFQKEEREPIAESRTRGEKS